MGLRKRKLIYTKFSGAYMDSEHTISVRDFPTITLSIIAAGNNRYFELTGDTENVGLADK
jgi:hypothetical protein